MKELFYIMYSVYKKSGDTVTEAYLTSVLVVGALRFALTLPLVVFFVDLIHSESIKIIGPLYFVICLIYSYLKAPQKQNCDSHKKYGKTHKLFAYSIMILILFWGPLGGILVEKYIIKGYGLEGWLLRFFN